MTDTAAPRQVACQGCSTQTTTAFQCPLCQAEATADCGFFCTQECFAKNWLKHRNTLHKSGVVRKTKRLPADAAAAAPAGTTEKGRQARGGKRSRAGDEAASGTGKERLKKTAGTQRYSDPTGSGAYSQLPTSAISPIPTHRDTNSMIFFTVRCPCPSQQ
ncbi:conserved hypothetical protein [Leishmania infantum JPCM5]|uniref:C6H2-type domain-containing protein n=1 Tax=Leishmania infantum TaxID=5671 RepID=E9AG58_LEIIN|nr:conserved hypothetical protein [Leishmania infantum JPCM5]CBZ08342.1 conserved hypothetical protein [Leishmania infantum JPCM5]|eukprot:XP_003392210.1 conserved hypothetical protein [Leishmania infantum JPCM5]